MQLLEGFNFGLLTSYPKIFCGYSDAGVLWNAIFARTRIVTYYGPNFSTFMNRKAGDYTSRCFQDCLFTPEPLALRPSETWSDDIWIMNQETRTFHRASGWWPVQEGEAEGTLIGGSIHSLNLLQGSEYAPGLEDSILCLEHPSEGKASLLSLDTMLRALALQPGFKGVRGLVIGRYTRAAEIAPNDLRAMLQSIPATASLPVAANFDFGHTTPMMTLPIGGVCRLTVTRSRVAFSLDQH
jgi:muramoyltetrapeptide carboxypeptidase LdcA involved in peptidoglycan recycling